MEAHRILTCLLPCISESWSSEILILSMHVTQQHIPIVLPQWSLYFLRFAEENSKWQGFLESLT